jgi:hypothetical protein
VSVGEGIALGAACVSLAWWKVTTYRYTKARRRAKTAVAEY